MIGLNLHGTNSFIRNFLQLVTGYNAAVYIWVAEIIVMFMIASVLVLNLLDSRFDKKKTNIIIVLYLCVMAIVNIVLILMFVGRFEIFAQLTLWSFAFLLTIAAIYISKWSIAKTLFGSLVGISIIAILMETSMIVMFLFEDKVLMGTAMLIAFSIQAAFLARFLNKVFKPYFIYTFREFPSNCGWYCLIPIAQIVIHCLYFLYNTTISFSADVRLCINMAMVHLIMALSYRLLFFHINSAREKERERMNVRIYEAQVEALSAQINAARETVNSLKIMRHDIKHHIGTMSAFFDNGEIDKAKEYMGYVGRSVDALQREKFCENSIINACLEYYIGKARDEDINISYMATVPNDATKNDMEFSTVIANALENAINACKKINRKNRKINLKCNVSGDKILFEVKNTYRGRVEFTEESLPITQSGVGITSIMSYAKANNANVQFLAEEDMFVFRIVANML